MPGPHKPFHIYQYYINGINLIKNIIIQINQWTHLSTIYNFLFLQKDQYKDESK